MNKSPGPKPKDLAAAKAKYEAAEARLKAAQSAEIQRSTQETRAELEAARGALGPARLALRDAELDSQLRANAAQAEVDRREEAAKNLIRENLAAVKRADEWLDGVAHGKIGQAAPNHPAAVARIAQVRGQQKLRQEAAAAIAADPATPERLAEADRQPSDAAEKSERDAYDRWAERMKSGRLREPMPNSPGARARHAEAQAAEQARQAERQAAAPGKPAAPSRPPGVL